MAHSPSQKWEGNKLVERAQDARGASEENTAAAVTGRPNDTPVRDPEPAPLGGNSTFSSRRKAREQAEKKSSSKAVQEAENKAVKGSRKK